MTQFDQATHISNAVNDAHKAHCWRWSSNNDPSLAIDPFVAPPEESVSNFPNFFNEESYQLAQQATQTDDIRATFDIPDAAITIENAPFTEKKWAASAGVDIGVLIPVNETFSITAQAGVRYVADLEGDDSAIGGLGLGSINDTGKRVSVPLSIAARFDF